MQRVRSWILVLCAPVVMFAAGGCPANIEDTATNSVRTAANAAATAVLKQIAALEVTRTPSATDIEALGSALGLTAAQQQQAQEIYATLAGTVEDASGAAANDLHAALTEAQRMMLNTIAAEMLDQMGATPEQTALAQTLLDVVSARLGLTADQRGQFDIVRRGLREGIAQRRIQARTDFMGVLTAAQTSILNQLETN